MIPIWLALKETQLCNQAIQVDTFCWNIMVKVLTCGLTLIIGELLAHEVLQSLKGTEHAWLIDLLLAFNW